MRRIREVLRLKFQLGLNDSQVASSAGIARATVQDYTRRIAATGLSHEQLLAWLRAEHQVLLQAVEHHHLLRGAGQNRHLLALQILQALDARLG